MTLLYHLCYHLFTSLTTLYIIFISYINHIIIEKLISSLNKKTAVIPLSAGLDSRLILSGLKTKKYFEF